MTRTLPDPKVVLGNIPDDAEFNRLVEYYPTYKWVHRSALLSGYFQGRSVEQLAEDKLTAKGTDISTRGGQSISAEQLWVCKKVRRTLIRLLYLRYLSDGKTRRQANALLVKAFGSSKASDGGKSGIRKATQRRVSKK